MTPSQPRVGILAIRGLFALALLYTIAIARPLLLPIVLAVLLAILLAPVVAAMQGLGVPRGLASGLVVLSILLASGAAIYSLAEPTANLLSGAPDRVREVERKLQFIREPVAMVSEAAEQVQNGLGGAGGDTPARVTISDSSPAVTLLRGARGLVGTLVVSLTLVFFFLSNGRRFLLKLIRVLPTLGARKRALRAAAGVRRYASTHLLTVSAINAGLGTAVGAVLHALGLPNPVLWGVMAAVLNFVPYLGAMVGIAIVFVVAIGAIDPVQKALLAPTLYLLLTGLEGTVVTPSILGRSMQVTPVAVFLSVLFWGWIWGVPGALLAVPILVTVKAIADSYPSVEPVKEFLTH